MLCALALAPAALFAQAHAARAAAAGAAAGASHAAPPAQPADRAEAGVHERRRRPARPDQAGPDGRVRRADRASSKGRWRRREDATRKQQAAGWKVYKAAEPIGANALYVIIVDPAVPDAEYELFAMLQKTMTPDELRAPETAEMWKRYAGDVRGRLTAG